MQLTSHDSSDKSPENISFVFASQDFCCNMLLNLLHGLQMTLQLLAQPDSTGVVIFHL